MENQKSNGLKIALIISLCLNLFFLSVGAAMFLKSKMLSSSKERIEYIAGYLKLTKAQKIELWQLTGPIREYRRDMREKRDTEISELCAELSDNNPDYEKINQIIGNMVEARGKFLGFAAEQLEPFLKDLTSEQRQIIVDKIEKLKNTGNGRLANRNIF